MPVHGMVADFVMAETAWEKATTAWRPNFTITFIMLASKYTLLFIME